MGILNYIKEKKASFQGQIDSRRSQVLENKKLKLRELELKNQKLAEELKINRAISKQELELKNAKRENFSSTFAGKVASNIKAKVNENKKKNKSSPGNIFTQQATYNNPFTRIK